MLLSRRTILRSALSTSAVASLAGSVPNFLLSTSALAAQRNVKGTDQPILVVVQLSGGNDGLNTVVPFTHDVYQKNRTVLRIAPEQALKLSDDIGLHPTMTGFKQLFDESKLSVLQGIGYPNPDRSHFESMDLWHTAGIYRDQQAAGGRMTGWLGRYLDATAAQTSGADVAALHLGQQRQPLALRGAAVAVPSVADLSGFKLNTEGESAVQAAAQPLSAGPRGQGDDLLGFLRRSNLSALSASQRIAEAVGSYSSPVTFPATALAEQLKGVSQLISAGMATRIYYVEQEGYDTHSNQAAAHYGLLSQLSEAVTAFLRDVEHHGQQDRVVVMIFSEFGRRVDENASAGTDHGAAAPMFLAGSPIRPGIIGEHPSLTDLDQGDLKHHTDFRRVYASLLANWLGFGDVSPILGKKYEPLELLA